MFPRGGDLSEIELASKSTKPTTLYVVDVMTEIEKICHWVWSLFQRLEISNMVPKSPN